jgi:UDP-glucose 4-epimerase
LNQILRGEPLTIFGDGTQTRAFSHVSDVAPIIASSVLRPEAEGQVFDIGADRPCSVNELGEAVSRAMGVPFRPRYEPARAEVRHTFASHDKARRVLGYESRVPLEQGIATMAAWVKSVGARASQSFGPLELDLNLPPSWRESE